MIPANFHSLFGSKHDYGLRTVPQQNAGGARVYWPRGALFVDESDHVPHTASGDQLGCWVDVSHVA